MTTNGSTTPRPVHTIGYIGLGNAGFSLCSNLPKAGYNVVVHDQDASREDRAASEWKNTVASHGDPGAFKDCEVIITMLPHGKIVREVLLGKNGIAKALKPGTIVIDTSSSSPFDTQTLATELSQHSLELVDAPLTQTYMHATDEGKSTLMVGADTAELFATVKPILSHMATYIFHMGRSSTGHAMKTLNNYIMASSLAALSDSLVTGQKYGLDPQTMIDVLNVGTGVCFPTLDTMRRDGLTKRFNSGFGLALLVKDLGITEEFMAHSEFDTKLPGVVREYLADALQHTRDPQTADHTELLTGWERRCGVQLKTTEQHSDIPEEDFAHRLKGLNRP